MSPPSLTSKKRGESWTEDGLRAAVNAVQRGRLTQREASARYNIPRRTLRDHLTTGSITKRLGRKPIFTKSQESDLAGRIKRFAKIGVPLTPKFIRKQAFLFCERYDIKNNFSEKKRLAGPDWLKSFLKRNPSIRKRKPQIMNPARALKLNKPIVEQHFRAVRELYNELDISRHPERLYNMDEKGCRITVHKQQTVLAEKGNKRVHLIAPEHAENVTIAMCVNAIGTAIPPMILFKGQRQRTDLTENLPAGTLVRMAPKGSMTSDLFVEFIQHLGKFKVAEKCLLIFDGAKCHLSCEALDEADKNGIVLYCLPSNTTHELQPLDKSINKSYEHHWDEAVMNFLYANVDRKLTKTTFNRIFSQVWPKCMTHSNIVNGFKATGLFPFNPDAIPDEAFAPSILTEIQNLPTREQDMHDSELDSDTDRIPLLSDPRFSIDEEPTNDTGSDDDTNNPLENLNPTHESVIQDTRSSENIDSQSISLHVSHSSICDQPMPDSGSKSGENAGNPLIISVKSRPSIYKPLLQDSEKYDAISDDNIKKRSRLVDYTSSTECSEEEEKTEKERDIGYFDLLPSVIGPSCSGLQKSIRERNTDSSITSTVSDFHLQRNFKLTVADVYGSSSSEDENEIQYIIHKDDYATPKKRFTNSEDNLPLSTFQIQKNKTPFHEFLPTPNYAVVKNEKPRKKAINYKGQRITKNLFTQDKDKSQKKKRKLSISKTNKKKSEKIKKTAKEIKKKNKKRYKPKKKEIKNTKDNQDHDETEDWYCHACYRNEKLAMRQCTICEKWYHEDCVGLTKGDIEFICSDC